MRTLFVALLLAAIAIPAVAQETPPPVGEPHAFNIPPKITLSLDNGLDVTLVPYGMLPKVTVSAVVRTGNIHEAADEVWLSDMTGDLMQEGTTSRSAEQIARETASMGGSVSVGVGLDQMSVSGSVLSEFGPDLVALIADILQHPAFPADELDRLKRDRIRQIRIARTQPGQIALEKFRNELHGEHPYGRIFPNESMVEGYSADDIRQFYADNAGAARTHVYVAGRFDSGAMQRAIRSAFADWASGPEPVSNPPSPTSAREIHIVDIPGAEQSNVYIGLPVIDPSHDDYVALQVTNSLLGGSFASRITSNIREDKGYTYSPFSSVSSRYRDAYWAQVAAISTPVTGAAIQEIFNEIDRLQAEAPSAEELQGIQNYMAGTFVLQNSSPGGIIGQLAFLDLHGLADSWLRNYVQNVHAVTPEDVRRMTETYLRDEDMMIVIAGDRAAIEAQVAPFGPMIP